MKWPTITDAMLVSLNGSSPFWSCRLVDADGRGHWFDMALSGKTARWT